MIYLCYCINQRLFFFFFLLLSNVPLYGCIPVLFIDLLSKGHLNCFQCEVIIDKAAIYICVKFVCKIEFLYPLGKYPRIIFLWHRLSEYLTFQDPAILFCRGAIPFSVSTTNLRLRCSVFVST